MFKRDYFLEALARGLHMHKRWVLEVFSVTRPSKTPAEFAYGVYTHPDTGMYGVRDVESDGENEAGETLLDDAMPGEPIFAPLEELRLNPGDMPNVREPLVTTYGNALINMFLVYGFGGKIAFRTGRMSIDSIEKEIVSRWNDDMSEEEAQKLPIDQQPIRTEEYIRYNEAFFHAAGFSQLCVPSATRKTMTADPAMIKRRDELLEIHKDELHDPVVLSKIMGELTQMDRAWMKGDPGERFYIKSKSYDVVRLKCFIMQGISSGFGQTGELIPQSLDEGWDISKLPAMANQLRDGSYSRGAQTALGGEATKFNHRIFQNCTIAEYDCGATHGLKIQMTKAKAPHFLSNFFLKGGKPVEITLENVDALIGTEVEVRSAAYCQTKGADFCEVCMGRRIASTPQALSTYAADIGGIFLQLFLSAMHGKALVTEKMDLRTSIT